MICGGRVFRPGWRLPKRVASAFSQKLLEARELPRLGGARRSGESMLKFLARRRVPLGFLAGIAAIWLADPTPRTLAIGAIVAAIGEGVRIWAAGHLEKGREVTMSGPYRLTRHPLYLGSTIIGAGLAIASASVVVALLVVIYLGVTLSAAIATEEAHLTAKFGEAYPEYREGRAAGRLAAVQRGAGDEEPRVSRGRRPARRPCAAVVQGFIAAFASAFLRCSMISHGSAGRCFQSTYFARSRRAIALNPSSWRYFMYSANRSGGVWTHGCSTSGAP